MNAVMIIMEVVECRQQNNVSTFIQELQDVASCQFATSVQRLTTPKSLNGPVIPDN
jgi:hypothetical protein